MSTTSRRTFLRHIAMTTAGVIVAPHALGCAKGGANGTPALAPAAPPPTPQQCVPTSPDLRGPYYLPGARQLSRGGKLAQLAGRPVVVSGAVRNSLCSPVHGATIEVWQADADGHYHDDLLRATLALGQTDTYSFRTIVPGNYREPGGWRPAHIHFRVQAPNHPALETQMYFAGDPYLADKDSCQVCDSHSPDRHIPMTRGDDGVEHVQFDITLRAITFAAP